MSSSFRFNKSFQKKDKYYISPMKTVIEEKETTETVDANAETGTESIIHYALKRKKLNY